MTLIRGTRTFAVFGTAYTIRVDALIPQVSHRISENSVVRSNALAVRRRRHSAAPLGELREQTRSEGRTILRYGPPPFW